jgi:predicted DNA-binding WGR domain protein
VQGRRVLFVCEKRAAIDVVFQRLKQRGLGQLGCLIHDSQTDKKEVIADLKATYEAFLAEREAPPEHRRRRRQLLHLLRQELEPLQGFHEAMRGATPETGLPPRDLLDRVLALREHLPALSALERERLPGYGVWYDHRERIDRFRLVLRDLQPDGVFCRHPLHPLGGQIGRAERPLEFLLGRLTEARDGLARLAECLDRAGVPAEWRRTLPEVEVLTGFAAQVAELAEWGVFAALDPACDLARRLHAEAARQRQLEAALVDARQACRHWRRRLPRQDVAAALAQAEAFERSLFCFLRPAWWRLRRALNECYDFRAHTVVPLGSQVLRALEDEYAAAAALARGEAAFREQFGVPLAAAELSARLTAVGAALAARPASVQALGRRLLAGDPRPTVRALLEAAQVLAALRAALATFLDSPETLELEHLPAALDRIEAASGQLPEFLLCLGELVQLPVPLGDCLRTLPLSTVQLEAAIADHSLDWRCRTDRRLNRFTAEVRRRHLGFLDAYSRAWEEINAAAVREAVRQRFLGHVRLSAAPAAGLSPREREIKKRYESGRRELEHEFGKVMRFRSIRDLASSDSGLVLRDLKPVWLMSPLSVSDAVPLDGSPFDVVIFDEASQITLEEAVPALFRARQAIVVGDEMQLPPTSFFSAKRDDGEGEAWYGDDEEQSEYDLSGNSFLNHAARSLPAQMLGWHYRSRSESLIGFSNWAFYQGRLLTVPDEELSHLARPEISAVAASDGQANAEPLLERPVSFHLLAQGTYQNRRNRSEAEYIAHLVRALVRHPRRLSLGIVAFSEAQQDEIESALERLAREDPEFRGQLEAEFEREEDGQFVGLLVKNLENIQGDERDVVILSVCYGHGPDGRMLMNFGPINQSGGERRLNVAFSRAKRHMAVVSSIRYSDIRNEYNDGANCLRSYLQYAACMSAGDCAGAGRVLRALAAGRDAAAEAARAAARDCVVSRQLAGALSRQGYEVDLGVGMSSFRCDLAIRRQGDAAYRLGVLLDTPDYYAQTDLLERDLMRPRLLEAFGWRVSSVLAKDWYQDADGVLARLLESLERGPEARTTPPAPAEMAPLDVEALIASVDVPDEPEPPVDLELGDGAPGAEQDEVLGDASEAVPPGLAEGRQLRFEFSEGTSSKFWEVWYDGPYLSVRFGRIGSDGQTRVKAFATRNEAAAEAARLVRQKLGKGYRPVPASG